MLELDSRGMPAGVRQKIDELFIKVAAGECKPDELKEELERWGLFEEYEDRFLSLFRK